MDQYVNEANKLQGVGYAKDDAAKQRESSSDLLDQLEQLVRVHGAVELHFDGKDFEVRSSGVCTYGRGFRQQLRSRVQLDINKVTQGLAGGDAAMEQVSKY